MFNYPHRIEALRNILREKNLDALIVSFLPNIRYLTGYSGSNGLVVLTSKRLFFLTDFRYKEQAHQEVTADRIVVTRDPLIETAAGRKLLEGYSHVAFEKDHTSYTDYLELKKYFHNIRFIPSEDSIERLACVKEQAEIDIIAEAAKITDRVFSSILGMIKPGVAEKDIAAEIAYLHRSFGAEKDSFDTIVASGPRGGLPHGRATEKKIRKGELVTVDFGCVYQGYCSDLTRTVAAGKPSARDKTIYQIVFDAQKLAVDAARSGLTAIELDTVARSYIKKKGYGKYFGHGLGHGVGLQIHTFPKVNWKTNYTLEPGNVITIEPGIYLPHECGVRIEDDVVIRAGGCEVLTSSPKELIVL